MRAQYCTAERTGQEVQDMARDLKGRITVDARDADEAAADRDK